MGLLRRIPIVAAGISRFLNLLSPVVKSCLPERNYFVRSFFTGVVCFMALFMANSTLMAKTPSGTVLSNMVTVAYSNVANVPFTQTAWVTNTVSDFVDYNVTSKTTNAPVGSTTYLKFIINCSNNYSDIFHLVIRSNKYTNMHVELDGDMNGNGIYDAGDIRVTNTPAISEGGYFTVFLAVNVPPSTAVGITNNIVVEVKTVRSNMFNFVQRITNKVITVASTNSVSTNHVLNVTANDGVKLISDFGGNEYLNLSDALINIVLEKMPSNMSSVTLYYDVSQNPDGPSGSSHDRSLRLTWNGSSWQGLIPVSDPEIHDGVTVKFLVSVDGVIYDNSGKLYKYQVKQRPDQGNGFNVFPTILDLRVDKNINIFYKVFTKGKVKIEIYDLKGDLVRQFDENVKDPGSYGPLLWDGKNHSGMTVAVGMYFVTIRSSDGNQVRKVIILK